MNHSSAWEALSKRFSALATERDFVLWGYSVRHPPQGVEDRTLHRTWQTEGLAFNTDYTSLTIQGTYPLTPELFLLVNRLEWLAWTAGTLLRPNADRPERDWFIHVFRESNPLIERSDIQGKLDRIAARSAEVAGQLATTCRSPEQRFVTPPAGAWQAPFETLRNAFHTFAMENFEFRLDLHAYTTPRFFGNMDELQRLQVQLLQLGRSVDVQSSGECSLAVDSGRFAQFRDLCEQAGRSLPPFLKPPMNLFPSGSWHLPSRRNENHLMDWFVFLWAASPPSFQACIDSRDDGARKAVWRGGNPFLASVLAIDQLIRGYRPDTVPLFAQRLAEVSPWIAFEDRPAVKEAITAAFQEPERKRVAAPVDPGSYTVQDILDFLIFRKRLPEYERQRDMHFPPIMPPGGTYNLVAFSLANRPNEPRLTEAAATKLPTFRKLVRVARQEYHSDLDETMFRCIVAEVLDAAAVPADDAWAMTVDDFGTLWEGTLKGGQSQNDVRVGTDQSVADSMTHTLPTVTANANPQSGAVAVDPHVERYFAQFDERMRPVQALWERAMRATPGAREVNGRQSIPLTTREAWDAFMAAFEFEFGTNGTTVENCNRLLRDGVFPPPGWDERAWRALAQSVGANPDDAGTGAGRTRITDAAMTAANAARLQRFAGGTVAIPPVAPAPVAEPVPSTVTPPSVAEAEDTHEAEHLNDRHETILVEMLSLEALTQRTRQTQGYIVGKCQRGANPESWKSYFSDLVAWGLVASQTGRGGGCWLTARGKDTAERLKK